MRCALICASSFSCASRAFLFLLLQLLSLLLLLQLLFLLFFTLSFSCASRAFLWLLLQLLLLLLLLLLQFLFFLFFTLSFSCASRERVCARARERESAKARARAGEGGPIFRNETGKKVKKHETKETSIQGDTPKFFLPLFAGSFSVNNKKERKNKKHLR